MTCKTYADFQDSTKLNGDVSFNDTEQSNQNASHNKKNKLQPRLNRKQIENSISSRSNSNSRDKIEIAELRKYTQFWNKYSYLYPYCDLSKITVEPESFVKGCCGQCHGGSPPVGFDTSSSSIEIPQQFVFKKLTKKTSISLKKYGMSEAADLNELWLSLFAGLHECKYIHLLSGLITASDIPNPTGSNLCGFLSEKAALGDFAKFLKKSNTEVDLSFILRELLHVAEAINFIHEKNFVHGDIRPENILVFYAENGEITLKLTDFDLCCNFDRYVNFVKHDDSQDFENVADVKVWHLNSLPKEALLKRTIRELLIEYDWELYGLTVARVFDKISLKWRMKFPYIAAMVDKFTDDGCWMNSNSYELVKWCIEIENSRLEK